MKSNTESMGVFFYKNSNISIFPTACQEVPFWAKQDFEIQIYARWKCQKEAFYGKCKIYFQL